MPVVRDPETRLAAMDALLARFGIDGDRDDNLAMIVSARPTLNALLPLAVAIGAMPLLAIQGFSPWTVLLGGAIATEVSWILFRRIFLLFVSADRFLLIRITKLTYRFIRIQIDESPPTGIVERRAGDRGAVCFDYVRTARSTVRLATSAKNHDGVATALGILSAAPTAQAWLREQRAERSDGSSSG